METDAPFMIFFHSLECTKALGSAFTSVSTGALRFSLYFTGCSEPSAVVIVSLVIVVRRRRRLPTLASARVSRVWPPPFSC